MTIITLTGFSQTYISPDNQKIKISGAMFNDISSERIIFYRHSQTFYALPDNIALTSDAKAKTNTGVALYFITDAENIKIHFKMLEGKNSYWLYTLYYIDGDSIETVKLKRDAVAAGDSTFVININSPSAGSHVYQIVLSTFCTYGFYGLTLTGGSESLENYNLPYRPFYVAYGNSITHGRGQNTGNQTYPWVLADKMNWETYNIAVGGAKTSVPMAAMIKNDITKTIDFLTILIGFNDAVGFAKDTLYYRKKLIAFIDTVRTGHPETTIFVIGQTYTIATENSNGEPVNFDDWRKVQKYVVDSLKAQGDSLIYYLNGADFTNYNDLNNPPNDKVHLSVNGAYHLGNALADTILKILCNPNKINYHTSNKERLKLYPNPAHNFVTLSGFSKKSKTIEVFNINGKPVMNKKINDKRQNITLNLKNFENGIYLIKTECSTVKFIKNE